ncbi:MAG: thioredoxin family protein [Candidatus Hydrogenedentes bacterium]|nr:thioredoxin family protein [Candidatus Hydrogenedentota bacterium]
MKRASRPLRPLRSFLRVLPALALLWTSAGDAAAAEAAITWQPTYEKAVEESFVQQKPLLLDFTAEWCGWCKKMDEEVYATPEVSGILKDFVCVKVDIEQNPAVALAYEVQSIPRTIILSADKRIISDQMGFYTADVFAEFLKEAKDWKPGLELPPSAPEIAAARIEETVPDTVDTPDAAAKLLRLLASQDVDLRAKAEAAVVKALPQMLPTLVKALSSEVLAERIAALEALRKNGTDVAPFDPWASRPERDEAVKPWLAWLAQQPAVTLETPQTQTP